MNVERPDTSGGTGTGLLQPPDDVADPLLWHTVQPVLARHPATPRNEPCPGCGAPSPCGPRRLAEHALAVACGSSVAARGAAAHNGQVVSEVVRRASADDTDTDSGAVAADVGSGSGRMDAADDRPAARGAAVRESPSVDPAAVAVAGDAEALREASEERGGAERDSARNGSRRSRATATTSGTAKGAARDTAKPAEASPTGATESAAAKSTGQSTRKRAAKPKRGAGTPKVHPVKPAAEGEDATKDARKDAATTDVPPKTAGRRKAPSGTTAISSATTGTPSVTKGRDAARTRKPADPERDAVGAAPGSSRGKQRTSTVPKPRTSQSAGATRG